MEESNEERKNMINNEEDRRRAKKNKEERRITKQSGKEERSGLGSFWVFTWFCSGLLRFFLLRSAYLMVFDGIQ